MIIERISKIGTKAVRAVSLMIAVIFFLYGSLTIFDMFRTEIRAGSNDLLRFRPDTGEDRPPYLDELKEINPDTCAWIRIYGTGIDHPVMQGKDDMEYINKDVYGEYSIAGSVFLSVLNNRDFPGPYELIYGHHMENGAMFGDLDRFRDEDFFLNRSFKRYRDDEGSLVLDGTVYDLEVFSVLLTDAYDDMVYMADKDEEDMKDLLGYLRKKSLYFRDIEKVSHVIALSTCDSSSSYGRTVVFFKMTRRKGPFVLKEREETTVIRTVRTNEEQGSWPFLDLLLLILTVYTAFPLHLVKREEILTMRFSLTLCLIISLILLSLFMIFYDISGKIGITGRFSPVFILGLSAVWGIRKGSYRLKNGRGDYK